MTYKDKIIAEIEKLMNYRSKTLVDGSYWDYKRLIDFINSLPENSTSEDLEQAADKALDTFDIADMMCGSYEGWKMLEMFKLGAQWMAEQGITREAEIEVHGDVGWVKSGTSIISIPDGYFKDGDKIIIQVRRKENSDD